MSRIAVIDIGKTNAKLALVEAETLAEVAVVTRPNTPLQGPWPQTDLEGHWQFFLHHLSAFHAAHGVDAISVTTHGAAAVLLDRTGRLAVPMLDYEHAGPDALAADYDRLRPAFAQTGSPRLPAGLNLGAQLHWLLATQPGLSQALAHVLTYPQYWGWRLTGELASDVSSLGCHTDLWDPWRGQFSDLVPSLGLENRMAPARRANEVLGRLRPQIAAATGLRPDTPVAVGIHDSNASLYPHVLGREGAFSVVSTGTWVVAMAVRGQAVPLDPLRDVLVNVDGLGQPVPSARFMGGREFQVMRPVSDVAPTAADRDHVLGTGLMLLPSVQQGSGPFPDRRSDWTVAPAGAGVQQVALSWYLALMTHVCLTLIGARGPVIVEGPFARNPDYTAMLASVSAGGVELAASATGTSVGAALLCLDQARPPDTRKVAGDPALAAYAATWRAAVEGGSP
ncbi:MAG: carbohydrate kinase [Alphaproteobacteria bacterium]|nr:carbohydrate kinase [Alphaproteobacteria bacterium]